MVRRHLISLRALLWPATGVTALLASGCRKDREMAEQLEMPDTMVIMEALADEEMQDSLLDVMPGGEMVRGDSAAAEQLLMEKLESGSQPREE